MADATYDIRFTQTGAEQVSRAFGKAQGAADTMASSFMRAASSLLAAGGLVAGLQKSLELAREQAKVERILARAVGDTAASWKEFASQVQRATNYGDEVLLQQITIAKQMGLTDRETRRLIVASANLAETMGRDLAPVMLQLAKTYSGQKGEIGELVPAIREMTSAQLASGDAIQYVIDKYSGAAEAAADSIEQSKNRWGDLLELLGAQFVTETETSVRASIALAEGLYSAGDAAAVFGGKLGLFSAGIALFNEFFGEADKALDTLIEKAPEAAEAMGPFIDMAILSERLKASAEAARPAQEAFVESIIDEANARQDLIDSYEEEQRLRDEAHTAKMVQFEQEIALQEEQQAEFLRRIRERAEAQKLANLGTVASMLGAFGQLNQAMKGNAEVTKRMAQAQALIDTYAGANRALGAYPPPFSFIAAAAVIASGLANVAQIQSQRFATGGSFVTNGPMTLASGNSRYIVGDNPGGRERVDVTPLSSANRNGPRAATFQLIFNGPITNGQYVRDVIAPAVRDAARSA